LGFEGVELFEVAGVGHHGGELFECVELVHGGRGPKAKVED
jgi:hypothetical protein